MRLLPDPTEGLHPAIPATPSPLALSAVFEPYIIGAVLGGVTSLGALAFRRSPAIGTKVACWTTLIAFLPTAEKVRAKSKGQRAFLEKHNIKVGKSKWVERIGKFDCDDAVLGAGILAVVLRLGRIKPGGWVARWTRKEPVDVNPIIMGIGSFAYGSFLGVLAARTLPLPGMREAVLEDWRRKMVAREWRDEVQRCIAEQRLLGVGQDHKTGVAGGALDWSNKMQDRSLDMQAKSLGIRQASLAAISSSGNSSSPDETAFEQMFLSENHSTDVEDPKPHHSVFLDGKRFFQASRNPNYQAPSIEALQDHLKILQQQRLELLPEAEKLWYMKATYEGKALPFLKEEQIDAAESLYDDVKARMIFQTLGQTHNSIWSHISDLDWLIADTNKQIHQFQAKKDGKIWTPALSDRARGIVPHAAILGLEQALAQNALDLQQMDARKPKVLEDIDRLHRELPPEVVDGNQGEDPRRAELDKLEEFTVTFFALAKVVEAHKVIIAALKRGENEVDEEVNNLGKRGGKK